MNRPFSADSLWVKNNILKNKLNITNYNELDLKEKQLIKEKLQFVTISNFTKNDFINLHNFLYKDLYEFAGKLRDENVFINGYMPCQYEIIDLCLTDLFNMKFNVKNIDEQIKFLAYFYSELCVILPFRDGNETTIRIFLEHWCKNNGYEFSFNDIDEDKLIESTKYAFYYDTSKLENLFKEKN